MEFYFIPFDRHRIRLGDGDPWFLVEIVVRTTIIFIYAILLLRVFDNEGMKNMTFLDYFLVIALGSAAGDPMFYPQIPLLYGLIVITVIILLKEFLDRITSHHHAFQDLILPTPTLVIKEGEVQETSLHKKNLSKKRLFSQLRQAGIEQTGEVRLCYLEPDGEVSIFKYASKTSNKKGISVVPPQV